MSANQHTIWGNKASNGLPPCDHANVHRTLAQCAKIMGISKARAQQIELVALRKLKNHPKMIEIAIEAGLIANS